MYLRPLGNKVLIKPLEEKYEGKIIIPDVAKDKPTRGLVLAIGPGDRDDNGIVHPLSIAKDAIVLFGKYAGTEIEHNGETLYIMRETDIFLEICPRDPANEGGVIPL